MKCSDLNSLFKPGQKGKLLSGSIFLCQKSWVWMAWGSNCNMWRTRESPVVNTGETKVTFTKNSRVCDDEDSALFTHSSRLTKPCRLVKRNDPWWNKQSELRLQIILESGPQTARSFTVWFGKYVFLWVQHYSQRLQNIQGCFWNGLVITGHEVRYGT